MEDMPKKRPLSANDVGDWFINAIDRASGDVITPLMVQRLIYFAQAWYLANTGNALFDDEFEAWATGPVATSVFGRFEHAAFEHIPFIDNVRSITGTKLECLEAIQERYGVYKAQKLDELSQEAGGPWEKARGKLAPEARCNTVITKDAMKRFYGEKIGKSWK